MNANRFSSSRRSLRGFSTTELMIAVAITALVMGMIIPGMVFYARMAKSLRTDQQLQRDAILFEQRMNLDMAQVFEVNSVSSTVINYSHHHSEFIADSSQPTGFRYEQSTTRTTLIYRDADNDPDTIRDNTLTEQRVVTDSDGDVVEDTEKVIFNRLSPMKDEDGDAIPIFQSITTNGTTYVLFRARIGDHVADRKSMTTEEATQTDADDAITGPGYQGFVLYYVFAPRQRIAS